MYGKETIQITGAELKVFNWKRDTKRIFRNISPSQFQDARMISFETEDILQPVDLNLEKMETSDLFGWSKWITPSLSRLIYVLAGMVFYGLIRAYLRVLFSPKTEGTQLPTYTVDFQQPGLAPRRPDPVLTLSTPL